MTGATVTRVGSGKACVTGLSFAPNNVQATLAGGSYVVTAGISNQVAPGFTCSGTNAVWVEVFDSKSQTNVDTWSVYLIFQ
jgi:hypothetical protein